MPTNPKMEFKTTAVISSASHQIIRTSATVSFTDTKSTVSSTFSSTHKVPETSTSKSQNGTENTSKTSSSIEHQYHNHAEKKSHETLRVCRDFIRGLCRRAKSCRYPHVLSSDQVVFCHDFQNSGCSRINCRFLHYTIQEEEYYRQFGKFPCPNEPQPAEWIPTYNRNHAPPPEVWNNNYGVERFPPDNYHHAKRPRFQHEQQVENENNYNYQNEIIAMMKRFEEEQSMLRRRVEVNEIKIAELRASNEFLLLHLRSSRIVNPVTVTNTMTNSNAQQGTQVISTPVQVSMATPQTQIIASSAPLAIQPTINTTQPICGSQIIGSQITLTPGITMTSQANVIAMSQATQPIISYPVMTHMPH